MFTFLKIAVLKRIVNAVEPSDTYKVTRALQLFYVGAEIMVGDFFTTANFFSNCTLYSRPISLGS